MLRPTELSRSSELSRHEISFHENQSAVDPDEYVEVVATPRPSPKPYTRKLERMRPPFMVIKMRNFCSRFIFILWGTTRKTKLKPKSKLKTDCLKVFE